MANIFEADTYKDASHPKIYGLAHFVVGQFLVIEYDLQAYGVGYLQDSGPRVDAITHTRAIEPAVAGVVEERPLPTMSKIELFNDPRYKKLGVQLGDLLKIVDAFPVDRERTGPSSLRIPEGHLERGLAVGMFAQGNRNYDFSSLFMGAALLSYRNEVPLQPMIVATQPINSLAGFRKEIVRVIVAPPLRHNPNLKKREALAELTDDLGVVFERDFRRARHWANFDAKYNRMTPLKRPGRIRRHT